MTLVAVVGIFVAYIAAVWLGNWQGRKWNDLPSLRVGSVVRFRGPQVGIEHRLKIQSIEYNTDECIAVLRNGKEKQ